MFIVKNRKIFFIISAVLVGLATWSIFSYGFNLGVDFRGGTITEIRYSTERPDKILIENAVSRLEFGGFSVRPSGDLGFIIRTRELGQEEISFLYAALSSVNSDYSIERSNTIGPVAGTELKRKAMLAVLIVILMIVLFITFAFRKVSRPVASWKYGLATIIALAHDVVVPTGAFVFLGRLMGIEIDLLFVSGLLAILGYSVHDTIVVFDRVRENLRINEEQNKHEDFELTVGKSVTQTIARSINTSLTLIIVLVFLYFLGTSAAKDFSLLLIIGAVAGTYSSIFLASPLLVSFYKRQK